MNAEEIYDRLRRVNEPITEMDIVSLGLVERLPLTKMVLKFTSGSPRNTAPVPERPQLAGQMENC